MDSQAEIGLIRRELATRYRLRDTTYTVAGRGFTITGVEDVDALLEDLIAADPECLDVRDERLPYWASVWPAAVALAEEILSGNQIRPGARVLELGCGLGLCAAAATLKEVSFTATDYQPDALLFTRLNCLQNIGEAPATGILDWRSPPPETRYDAILGSDLAYEERYYPPLVNCFDRLLKPRGRVLFGEPNRQIAKPFFQMLADKGWSCTKAFRTPKVTVYSIVRA